MNDDHARGAGTGGYLCVGCCGIGGLVYETGAGGYCQLSSPLRRVAIIGFPLMMHRVFALYSESHSRKLPT